MNYEIVIPTSGRPSLRALLEAIGPEGVIVVDDRREPAESLALGPDGNIYVVTDYPGIGAFALTPGG